MIRSRSSWTKLRLGLSAATAVTPGIAVAQDSTGVLMVRVYRHVDSTPVSGAFVRSGRVAAITDRAGVGRVELAARLSSVTVTHPQFEPYTFEMTIEPNVAQRADIYLGAVEGLNGGLGVTRSGGKVADEPMAVRILDPGEVAAARQRHPGDLGGLFRGPRLRLQATSGTLEAARLRLNGLPGQYHGVLIDGLPLLGPRPGSYGLAQLGLGDLVGVEVLPASSTALYGPTFGSGVVNLISRPADRDRYQLGLDQSSEKGGDVFFWGARRFSPRTGGSLFADFHQQRLVDADDDGWGEFTRAIRFSIRPRFQWDHPNGDGLRATIGGVTEDRTGGLLVTSSDPNPYREELRTRRIDLGVAGHRLEAAGGRWEAKLATVFQSSSYRFDALRERDRRSFLFGELSYRRAINRVTLTAGLGYQREAFRQRDFPAFDYTHEAPAGFARAIIPISARAVAAAAVRCDRHSVHGAQCWSSGAVLLRPNRATEGRFSIGEGYVAPTPLSDEVETIGLHTTLPVNAKAERIRTASIDVRISEGPLVMAASLGYSRVALPVRLIPFPGDPEGRLRLINVSEPTRVFTGELTAELSNGPMSGRAFYSYQNGSEGVPDGTGRRDLDLTPRHTVGLDLTWLAPVAAGGAATLELAYVGAQAVHDNPFLTRTPGYPLIGGTASVRSGRGRLFLSGENLLDKKLADYHPVLLPTLAAGGRRTMAPWAPLRGRVINIGALFDW